jgi:hypothetical protein
VTTVGCERVWKKGNDQQMTTTTLELNIDELRVLTDLLAADESRRSSPLADKVRLAFFDMDNFLSAAGLPPY